MTTWKLLDELGGHSVAVIHKGAGDKPWDVVVDLGDQSFPAQLPATVFTTEEPPLPEEPTEQGWYLASVQVDGFTEPLERRNDGWYVWRTGQLHGSWSSVWDGDSWIESVTITRLVPAPEPVTLPWSYADEHSNSSVVIQPASNPYMVEIAAKEEADGGTTYVYVPGAQLLRAAWAAAAEAEATS